ncbi:acetyl-CoA synthetase [Aliidongia dinghuensis]|uniref:Acetyl-CoA synthetase n=1 Tax=Aliidongia dinghuensis TaxID=1867774 RepID=A0A8J2Z087_9PROT|nr:acetate--CoA ligase family protein [Aliidongia dinghuensis]GGF43895.1 acetyl-CoA synthetase [Aliidongia dinghuensis]
MTRVHPRRADPTAIRRLLRPRSVAILGVSATPTALGSAVLRNLDRAGYAGEIHLINPKYTELYGRPCLRSVDDLPDGVDCVVLAIPRAAVLEVLAACGRKGIGGAIVFSAGFAEAGESGRADQARIAEIARTHGMAVEGPNCLGMVNYVDGAPLTFVDIPQHRPSDGAGIAILSQSGAMAAVLTVGLRHRGLNLAYSVSTGNEAASGIEDYLEELLDDPQVPVIAMIVEQFREPGRFLDLAGEARRRGKRLVLLHPGRSSAARASAATHTGAMVGDYQVMRTKVGHAGVVVVDRLEMLLDVAEIMARCPTLPQGGAAVMTESGAFKAVTLDLSEEVGLDLPPIGAETAALLRAALPDFIPPTNPLDLTAQALVDPDLYNRTLPALLGDAAYGAVLMGIILSDPETCALKFPAILSAIQRLRPEKPLIFAGLDEGAEVPSAYVDELRALGVPFFPTAERALAAIACLARACLARAGQAERAVPVEPVVPLVLSPGVIPEYRAKAILQTLGIPVPEGALAGTLAEAQAIAERVGYPVALKAQSQALSHKSDVGGVVLGLATAVALAEGWDRLHRAIGAARPGLALDGVLVEAMGRKGTELIVGARNDPDWGPVLLVGLGGVLAEALGDVRLLPPDLSHEAIVQELHRLKAGALLRGFRGSPPLDVDAAARIAARLGAFMLANPAVAEVDINPVVLLPAGEGALALDALISVE